MDFPIVTTGEVNGTIFVLAKGHPKELAGATLGLADAAGQVVQTTRSAYDGFYSFSMLPPGAYRLRIPNEQFAKRPLARTYTRDVVIGPDGSLLEGLDFTLELAQDAHPTHTKRPQFGPPAPVKRPPAKQRPVKRPPAKRAAVQPAARVADAGPAGPAFHVPGLCW